MAAEMILTDLIVNPFVTLGALGTVVGFVYGAWQRMLKVKALIDAGNWAGALKETIEFFDNNNEDITEAPPAVKEAESKGACLYSIVPADLQMILSTCANKVEMQTVEKYVKDMVKSGEYEFNIETSYATYKSEQGFITKLSDAGKISGSGFVIGKASVELFKRNLRGVPYQTEKFEKVKKNELSPVAIKLTVEKSGTVVVGYALDDREMKVLGVVKLSTIQGASPVEWLYKKYSDYEHPDMDVGKHKITIAQGYMCTREDNTDTVDWFDAKSFEFDIVE